jgi:hypothetical protein
LLLNELEIYLVTGVIRYDDIEMASKNFVRLYKSTYELTDEEKQTLDDARSAHKATSQVSEED